MSLVDQYLGQHAILDPQIAQGGPEGQGFWMDIQ